MFVGVIGWLFRVQGKELDQLRVSYELYKETRDDWCSSLAYLGTKPAFALEADSVAVCRGR